MHDFNKEKSNLISKRKVPYINGDDTSFRLFQDFQERKYSFFFTFNNFQNKEGIHKLK